MKKVLSTSLLLAAMAFAFTGCLKDKGFENHTYGINDPDTQPPGVGFPLGTTAKNTIGLDAGVATLQQIKNVIFINILGGVPAKSDVKVTLSLNDNLRTAYNAANGTSILQMPAAYYSLPSLTVTIPAGSMNGTIPINIPSTVPLDPSSSYGLGLTITAVDGGYKIADNFKNLFLEFTLKNRYDGNYTLGLNTKGWGAYGITDDNNYYPWFTNPDGTSIFMITGGPNAVRLFDEGIWGDFIQPCFQGTPPTAYSGFGATAPRFFFDLATNKVIDVVNDSPDDGRGRKFKLNTTSPTQPNTWDPGTKAIKCSYWMLQNGRPDQNINIVLTYRGPRP